MSTHANNNTTAPTTLPERLNLLQFNAAFATLCGSDMDLVSAAATLEAASDLLLDGIALARWVVVAADIPGDSPHRGAFDLGFVALARSVVRRADEAVREDVNVEAKETQ